MPHLTDDDLVLHYYGELEGDTAGQAAAHLRECGTCREALTKLQRVFALVDTVPEPALGDGFERVVWARLEPGLEHARHGWASWFILSPARLAWLVAIVVLVGAAFFAGRLSRPQPAARAGGDGVERPPRARAARRSLRTSRSIAIDARRPRERRERRGRRSPRRTDAGRTVALRQPPVSPDGASIRATSRWRRCSTIWSRSSSTSRRAPTA